MISSPSVVPMDTSPPADAHIASPNNAGNSVFHLQQNHSEGSQPELSTPKSLAFHPINRPSPPTKQQPPVQQHTPPPIKDNAQHKPSSSSSPSLSAVSVSTTTTPPLPTAKQRNLATSDLPSSGTSPSSTAVKKTAESSPHSPSLSPWCQNCQTSTTPLWRRDEAGQILCNACGLFLKLHGRPRPISLKTDTIKSRNRNKNNSAANSPATGPLDAAQKPEKVYKPRQKPRKKAEQTLNAKQKVAGKQEKTTASAKSSPALHPQDHHDTPSSPQNANGSSSSSTSSASNLKSLYHAENKPILAMASPALAPVASSTAAPMTPATSATVAAMPTPLQKETLPPLMASLDRVDPSINSSTPYLGWAQSPSFNPLSRSSHFSALNSPINSPFVSSATATTATTTSTLSTSTSTLAPLKDTEGNSFARHNAIKGLVSESLSSAHQPSLQAITSPLLLATTPSSHLHTHTGPSSLLNPAKNYYSPAFGAKDPESSSSQTRMPSFNPARTALDHLTSAAATSPYLSPVPQKSEARLPPIMSPYTQPKEEHVSSIKELHLSAPRAGSSQDTASTEHEQVLQTRVSELELVNDLLRARIAELEASEDAARRSEAIVRKSEILLRVRVNKLETKNKEYAKRVKSLQRLLLSSKGGEAAAASLENLALSDDDDNADIDDDDDDDEDNNDEGNRQVINGSGSGTPSTRTVMSVLNGASSEKAVHTLPHGEDKPSKKAKTDM